MLVLLLLLRHFAGCRVGVRRQCRSRMRATGRVRWIQGAPPAAARCEQNVAVRSSRRDQGSTACYGFSAGGARGEARCVAAVVVAAGGGGGIVRRSFAGACVWAPWGRCCVVEAACGAVGRQYTGCLARWKVGIRFDFSRAELGRCGSTLPGFTCCILPPHLEN
jgi:hypothetical protein